jgi:predicted dehydrogenase
VNSLRVGILGAGMIAQGFDHPGAPHVLSLAHAFSRSDRFTVAGFFDSRVERAERAEVRWGVPPSPRDRDAWLDAGWEVVYVATPDARHGADVRDVLARRPRGVLVEKPLSIDGSEAAALLTIARDNGVAVMTNFPRRWHSGVLRLREMAEKGQLSAPAAALVAISGGAVHNLPHTIDLFHTIWGGGWTVERAVAASGGVTALEWRRGAEACSMAVAECDSPHYIWEAHFYCAEGKVEFSRSPEILEWSAPVSHPQYPDYRVFAPVFRCEMEEEPLLCRVVAAFAEALESSSAAARAYDREIASQRLSTQVLRWF